MTEVRFFEPGTVPEFTTPKWYHGIERAPHLEQPGHHQRLRIAEEFVRLGVVEYGARTVSDMGAGDGGLLSLITDLGVDAWGYDLIPANVAGAAERGVDVELADVVADDVCFGDLAVCTEFLEHLIDPHRFVSLIPSRLVVASCPDGESHGNHYEFHTWGFDMPGFREMFENAGFEVVRHVPMGYQILMGVRK